MSALDVSMDKMTISDITDETTTNTNKDNDVSVCANCGKEGSDVNNTCNKCKQVKYCNAACKKKHRSKHKKECERRAAELHDEKLFKQPPPQYGDCPICFLRLPSLGSTGTRYMACCGKVICSGCVYAPVYDNQGNEVDNKKCPFCRTPHPKSDEETNERYEKRVVLNDAIAMYSFGQYYRDGLYGYPQDYAKALEFYNRAAELGYTEAYLNIGYAYSSGKGVEIDKKKARYYWGLAAMGGDIQARHNLGNNEAKAGNIDRALKHYLIAAGSGSSKSLELIKEMYSRRHAAREDYAKALQSYQTYLGEIRSRQRDQAAAFSEELYRYY